MACADPGFTAAASRFGQDISGSRPEVNSSSQVTGDADQTQEGLQMNCHEYFDHLAHSTYVCQEYYSGRQLKFIDALMEQTT